MIAYLRDSDSGSNHDGDDAAAMAERETALTQTEATTALILLLFANFLSSELVRLGHDHCFKQTSSQSEISRSTDPSNVQIRGIIPMTSRHVIVDEHLLAE